MRFLLRRSSSPAELEKRAEALLRSMLLKMRVDPCQLSANLPPVNPTDRPELTEELLEMLEDFEELAFDDPVEAKSTFHSFPEEMRSLREFQLALARVEQQLKEFAPAEERLRALLRAEPQDADACHLLADLLEDQEKNEEAEKYFLETLRLDSREPERTTPALLEEMKQIVKRVFSVLPEELAQDLLALPFVYQPRPTEQEVRDGLDPRATEEFVLAPDTDEESDDFELPEKIIFYTENILRNCEDTEDLQYELALLLLQDLGEFIGLDEGVIEQFIEQLGLE